MALAGSVMAAALVAGGCSSGPPSRQAGKTPPTMVTNPPLQLGVPAPPSSTTTTARALRLTTKYLERMTEGGLAASATQVWNANLGNCTSTLANFPQTVGIGPGECTKIALANDNPGYNVLAFPAPPLKDVIAQAGPGC
jgi:hypothetical protein